MSSKRSAGGAVRAVLGVAMVVAGLFAFGKTTFVLTTHDYIGAILFGTLALSFVGAGTELLKHEIAE